VVSDARPAATNAVDEFQFLSRRSRRLPASA